MSLFLSQNYLDKSFTHLGRILNFRMHDETIKKKRKWIKKTWLYGENPKGQSRAKMKRFRRLMGKTDKRMKGQQPRSIWSLYEFLNPFQNQRIGTFYPRMPFLNSRVYHGRSWCLSNYHIQGLKKWIFLNVPPLCSTKLWK